MDRERGSDCPPPYADPDFVIERQPEEPIAEAVVRGISAVEDVTPADLDPLYESIEVDALETMVRHVDERDAHVRVEFTIEGHGVLVDGDGTIRIVDDPHRLSPTSDPR